MGIKNKKMSFDIFLLRVFGWKMDSNGEAIEPIPNKKAQTEGRAINHNNIGSTPTKENQFTLIINVDKRLWRFWFYGGRCGLAHKLLP